MTYKKYTPYTIPEILEMRSQGMTYIKIADHFGISKARVGIIIKSERERKAVAERARVILQEIRSTNNWDKKFPLADMICVVNFQNRAVTVTKSRFRKSTKVSLRDIMDFLLPMVDGDGRAIDYLPAYRMSPLGPKTYKAMIEHLSSIDGGKVFQREWSQRREQLRDYLARTSRSCHHFERLGARCQIVDISAHGQLCMK